MAACTSCHGKQTASPQYYRQQKGAHLCSPSACRSPALTAALRCAAHALRCLAHLNSQTQCTSFSTPAAEPRLESCTRLCRRHARPSSRAAARQRCLLWRSRSSSSRGRERRPKLLKKGGIQGAWCNAQGTGAIFGAGQHSGWADIHSRGVAGFTAVLMEGHSGGCRCNWCAGCSLLPHVQHLAPPAGSRRLSQRRPLVRQMATPASCTVATSPRTSQVRGGSRQLSQATEGTYHSGEASPPLLTIAPCRNQAGVPGPQAPCPRSARAPCMQRRR